MKILVIDNDKFVRTIYESELHQQNIEVELAKDGAEGLEKAKSSKPDLIILELVITKINGFQLIEDFSFNEELKSVPIIVCSVLSQKQDVDEAIKLGVKKYFPKEDYSPKQVIREILELLMKKDF